MKFKIESSVFFFRLLIALVLMLLGDVSAQAQCNPEQIAKLLPDDGEINTGFGFSLAISGNIAIVGAYGDDENGSSSGSAYLFDTITGKKITKLLPDDGAAGDQFGYSVAISGTVAIVGAWFENDDHFGAAYLFDAKTGQQLAKLVAEDRFHSHFGISVGIGGTTAIVGAIADDAGGESGAAYLFDTTTGQQLAKLLPDDGAEHDNFGSPVAISGNMAIIGATGDDDNGSNSGSAYLFDVGSFVQIAKLLPDDGAANDNFGKSVAISGTTAIVGARLTDDKGTRSGSAYLFDIITGQPIAKLLPDDNAEDDRFGFRVGISDTTAIVGAHKDDDNGEDSGSAYLFDTTTGQQIAKLLADDGTEEDNFGRSVGISGTTIIVGAWDGGGSGVDPGSAYQFDVSCSEVVVPDSFLVTRGTHVSGGVGELAESDNMDLSIQRSTVDTQSRTEFEVKSTSSTATPTSFEFSLEGTVFARSNVVQTIELFDYVANDWVLVDTSNAVRSPNPDSVVTATATGDLSRFVEAGTMCIEARIHFQSDSPRQRFASNTDQAIWTIGQ